VGRHSDLLRESAHYRHVISSLEVEEARLQAMRYDPYRSAQEEEVNL
jgi:ATP-binding cassette subfamily B protein